MKFTKEMEKRYPDFNFEVAYLPKTDGYKIIAKPNIVSEIEILASTFRSFENRNLKYDWSEVEKRIVDEVVADLQGLLKNLLGG